MSSCDEKIKAQCNFSIISDAEKLELETCNKTLDDFKKTVKVRKTVSVVNIN